MKRIKQELIYESTERDKVLITTTKTLCTITY